MLAKIETFFREHPIFTRSLFDQAMGEKGSANPHTLRNMLTHHLQQGHIVRIRRGLFAAIPYGADPDTYPINPFLIASSLADDAVIAYHSALVFHGIAYSSSYRFIYLTHSKPRYLTFRGESYQASLFPTALIAKGQTHCYVNREDVQGIDVQVVSKERTLVDVMDRPLLAGGWEEIWRSLDMLTRLKMSHVVDYALMLGTATTIAKVGYYLEQRKTELSIDEKYLTILQMRRPSSPHYMDSVVKENCKLMKRWNLLVPVSLIERDWDENLQWEPDL